MPLLPSSSTPGQTRQLFGGAITTSMPDGFDDMSKIREIPDNQEVFSQASTDRSVIVELLEQHDVAPPTLPAAFHVSSIAEDSSASSAHTHQTRTLPSEDFPALLADDPQLSVSIAYATHRVAKFRDVDEHASQVDVYLACVRLPRATTDLLVVFNDPVALHPAGSSARSGSSVAPTDADSTRDAILRLALSTLKIHDWSLIQ